MIQKLLTDILAGHRKAFDASFDSAHLEVLEQISREIIKTFKSGGKLLICGNGGSAADAQHIAAEFIGRFKRERRSLPAIALTTDTSIITAVANDYEYNKIFSRQVEGLGVKGDLLVGISTSGNSQNVIEAMTQAKTQGLVTVGFTGATGGKLKNVSDLCYTAQSNKTPHVQEMHITALHAVSEIVEDVFFGA